MLVGDVMSRTKKQTTEARQITFRCFDRNFGGENGAPGTGKDTMELPNKECLGGIRANVFFPT